MNAREGTTKGLTREEWELVSWAGNSENQVVIIQAIFVNKGLTRLAEAVEKLAESNKGK